MGSLTAAADGSHTSGAMIALMPTPEDAARLAIEGGEAAEDLHCTLYFLGDDGSVFTDEERRALIDQVADYANWIGQPIEARIFGANHWNSDGDSPSWVWAVGDDRGDGRPAVAPALANAYDAARYSVANVLDAENLPDQYTPWQPRICAAYSDELDLIIALEERLGSVTFDRVRVAFAGEHTDIPLGGDVTASARVLTPRWDEDVVHVEVETNRGGALLLDAMCTAAEGLAAELGVPVRVTGRTRTTARTAAAGPLRRQPTELELASRADFTQMDKAWHEAVDGTVEAWASVQEAMRAEITASIQAAAEADNLDLLDGLTVDTEDGARLLIARMIAYAREAGEQQQAEAEAQGIDIPEWSLDDEALTAAAIRDRLRQVGRTTARYLGVGLVQSAVRQAMRVWGSGSAEQVAAQVDEHLASLSGAAVEEQVGAAMSAAQNEGRMAVLAVAPPAEYTASEILDRNSCSPCRDIDGTRYTTLPDARAAYPSGGYTGCLGGSRCRGTLVTVWPQGDEQAAAAGMILAASADTMPPTHHEQGGGSVPYSIVQDHPDCGADTPWAVVKEATDELMGCHATETDAEDQARTLLAEEGNRPQRDDEDDVRRIGYTGETPSWEGVLAVEGIVTGDGREFAPGALTWADLPIPLRWNIEDSHGGEARTKAVNVGRIDRIWRDDNKIMGAGVLDLSDDNGQRAYDKLKGEFLRGVSIDADSIADADVEFVWPDDVNAGMEDGDEGDLLEMLFAQPEKMIFHGGRIRGATLVDIPAFAEAYVALLDEEGAVVAGGQPVGEAAVAEKFGAVGTHDTATSEGDWDGPANEARLPSPMTVATARNAYAWIDDDRIEDGELVKDAARFIHHEVGADGSPGAANLTACSTGIGILNGGRGGTTIPRADFQGVYNHLAGHLRDADREPPELNMRAGTLAGNSRHAFGSSLAGALNRAIERKMDEDTSRADIIADMANAAGISTGTVNEIIAGDINCPPEDRLAGFARALGVSAGSLMSAAEEDGCDYGMGGSMSASAAVRQPQAAWFSDPKLSLPTPITITDDGRIYGHAAQWGSCHIGQEGVCVQPPHEDAHPYYRTGEVKCDDGSRVAVGQITVGTGHAPLHMGASPAAEHYDNTGAAVADVAVGNDAHGIWVAGAVRPGADPLKVYELQAAGQVSGDWRRIGGELRLVGLLAVNVPGFPVPKMRARVASGEPQALVAAGRPTVAWGRSQEQTERDAVRIVMRMLSRRVHPGGR